MKTLGRDPAGSQVIAKPDNLKTLLGFQSTYKDTPDAAIEALRCIANALLLVDAARSLFLEKGVDGGDLTVSMLEVHCSECRFEVLQANSLPESPGTRPNLYSVSDSLLGNCRPKLIPRHHDGKEIQRLVHRRYHRFKTRMLDQPCPSWSHSRPRSHD